jgi:sulfite dehydrogenase (cytochrome) subunit B
MQSMIQVIPEAVRAKLIRFPMICAAVTLSFAFLDAARAGEAPVDLKAGAGADKVEGNCASCHSLDYIQMNAPFLSDAGWDAEVAKMINAFGAPINAADAKSIADYLRANYGK